VKNIPYGIDRKLIFEYCSKTLAMKKKVRKPRKKKEPPLPIPDSKIVDYLPLKVKKILEKSEYKFSQSEQILLTLLARIIVEISIKEDI
jgi:hypothetical protein